LGGLSIEDIYDIMFDRFEKGLEPADPEEVNKFASKQLDDLAVYEN